LDQALQRLVDRAEIIDTQHRYALGIDGRDWPLFRSVFADRIRLDFTDWHGGEPSELEADEWVARVAARQSGFDSTQHQMSNIVVTFDADARGAACTTYVIARHCIHSPEGDLIQAIGGYYSNRFARSEDGWRITDCTLKVSWTTGDRDLFKLAEQRLQERSANAP
jgi:hypothetical protein